MNLRKITQFDYNNKKVLLRVDLNVPVVEGRILDETRINKIIPTIKYLLKQNAKIILISHFGRPKSEKDIQYSLNFLTSVLSDKLGQEIFFCQDIVGDNAEKLANNLKSKEIMLLENIRFAEGETKNDLEFAKELTKLGEFYINDAFSCSHRAHASIVGIAELLPSCAGLLLEEEITQLAKYLLPTLESTIAIVGGSKISTKIDLLNNLITKVDYLIIGGAMANTFLKAKNYEIGNSLYEEDYINVAKAILNSSGKCQIILPQDVVVADEIAINAPNHIVEASKIPKNKIVLDVGPSTCTHINQILSKCKTVICNGPLGVFEYFPFSVGTISIAREIAKLTDEKKLISIAGGGDIVAAVSAAGLFDQFTYISTAGGAFLEWLEGKTLPGLKVLT